VISGNVLQFITTVTGLSATVNGGEESTIFSGGTDSTAAYGSNDAALAVLLDTGSSAWSLPTQYYEKGILPLFPYVTSQGLCDCKYRDSNDSLTVEFAAKISINVPARQFIVPIYDPATNEPQYFDAPRNTQQAHAFRVFEPGLPYARRCSAEEHVRRLRPRQRAALACAGELGLLQGFGYRACAGWPWGRAEGCWRW
jgi:hypothetical protein